MLSVYSGETPGGWITFPGGIFEPDTSSNIQTISSEGISYDRALNRWVPADWNHISPDGRHIVVQGQSGGLGVVDLTSGATRTINLPQAHGAWTLIDYTASGIYLTLMAGLDYADPGLWVVNPGSGQVRKLDGTQFWSQVDSRAAWGVTPAAGAELLRRLDLQTNAVSTQLAIPYHTPALAGDQSLELISIDAAGRPLVLLRDWQKPRPWHMALLEAANTLRDITIPVEWAGWPVYDNGDPLLASGHITAYRLTGGIWMIGGHIAGLALLGSDGVVRQLTTGPDNIFAIAGGCH